MRKNNNHLNNLLLSTGLFNKNLTKEDFRSTFTTNTTPFSIYRQVEAYGIDPFSTGMFSINENKKKKKLKRKKHRSKST